MMILNILIWHKYKQNDIDSQIYIIEMSISAKFPSILRQHKISIMMILNIFKILSSYLWIPEDNIVIFLYI